MCVFQTRDSEFNNGRFHCDNLPHIHFIGLGSVFEKKYLMLIKAEFL